MLIVSITQPSAKCFIAVIEYHSVCLCVVVSVWAGFWRCSLEYVNSFFLSPHRVALNMHLISVAHCRLISSHKAENAAVR